MHIDDNSDARRRVVITGMGAVTPLGLSVDAFWEGMMEGRSGAAPIQRFDATALTPNFACELKGFDPLQYVDRKQVQRLDPFVPYALAAADEALHDAGFAADTLTPEHRARVGVIFGSGIGGIHTFHEQTARFIENGRVSPFFIPMLISNIASGHLAIRYGFKGPSYAAVSACATGNHNLGDAFMLIRQGLADAVLCGGSEASITPLCITGFATMKALSTRNDAPETASRPFDATRDGFVMGEGAGALFVESLEHAEQRGARIYAEVVGLGLSSDAHHITAPDPEGIRLAIEMALRTAGLAPERVDYINAHSTSTPLGDAAETEAIKAAFGEHAYRLNVSSIKSMVGHLLGAAGAVEAIASILAIRHNRIPPTINFQEADPACDLNYTVNTPQERPVDVAMNNAFGFGGHNTAVLFRRWEG